MVVNRQYLLIPVHRLTKHGGTSQHNGFTLFKQIDGKATVLAQQTGKQRIIEGTAKLHRADRLTVESNRHHAADPGAALTGLQPADRLMVAVYLDDCQPGSREVVAMICGLVHPIKGSSRGM